MKRIGSGAEPSRESVSLPSEREAFFTPGLRRKPPKTLPVNRPQQITFEADPLLYATVSQDGRWLVYASGRDDLSGLWLRSADPVRVVLPKTVTREGGRLSAPAFSPDGKWIAFVGNGYDVKGDIYVMKLNDPEARPRRLTGRETEDGAPCFSPDGKTLYFHQARPGETRRKLVALEPESADQRPRPLDVGGDGAFPSISPDGRKCLFVSVREDPGGDIFLVHLKTGRVVPLTQGPEKDLFPVWFGDGEYIYFSRFALDTDRDGTVTPKDNAVVCRLRVNTPSPVACPVTSASYSAYQPMVAGSRLYFLSTQKGVSNLWALPLEGEIPARDHAGAQLDLAQELADQIPPDFHKAILGFHKVLERFSAQESYGGRAAYAMGRIYERMDMPDPAKKAFHMAAERFAGTLPEAALSRIHLICLEIRGRVKGTMTDREIQNLLGEARSGLEAVAAQYPDITRIMVRSRIEQARLLMTYGRDSGALLDAARLFDPVIEKGSAHRPQVAEAMVLRADLFRQIGQSEKLFPAYARVIREFPDVEEWADRAVERILELSVSRAGPERPEEKNRLLARVADKYRKELPRLAMGAWNRIGDIHFVADEWRQAKEAYRRVLEEFPVIATQTAAARLALAEILYREEQFRQTLDLYETEMASRPYEDYLYGLAHAAYVRKSIAAGEFLYRLGEVSSARNLFATLIREDYGIVEAHRGYIKCAAAQKQIPDILLRYRAQLEKHPDDPVTLYATGLCLTYVGGRKGLEEARSLIQHAIERQGQVEYYHQTLGYVLEILETVYGEQGMLEAGLESFRKAYFLNDPKNNPENASNLSLNLGNIYFLLGQYGKAFENYLRRFQSNIPFDQEETEILFYRRFGAAAFQVREREQPIGAFSKALDLIERRIQPKRASEVMGRINRYIFDRILTPALKRPDSVEGAKKLAERQAGLNRRVFEASRIPVGPPPDPSWTEYRGAMQALISEQEGVIRDLGPVIPEDRETALESLSYLIVRAREAMEFPQRLMELKAEMLDRLGLAFQEAEKWREARETFEQAYALNERLGLSRNLVSNQRSIAFNAYMEAGTRSGEERRHLLDLASEGFGRVIELVRKHGVAEKQRAERKKAVISLALDVALDEVSSSQAMYGFSAEQEERLAEAFISCIEIELGRLAPAKEAINRQLARYPPEKPVSDKDRYGVSLLLHRAGHLSYALRRPLEAFDHFRRSAELSHQLGNPVSAAINVANMAQVLAAMPPEGPEIGQSRSALFALDRNTIRLLDRFENVLEGLVIPSYHNTIGVFTLSMQQRGGAKTLEKAALDMSLLQRAGVHFSTGLKRLEKETLSNDRQALALRAALHLNMAEVSALCGEGQRAREHLSLALEITRSGLIPEFEWRALAGLGRLKEALRVLQTITMLRADCGPGEITGRFAPLVADLLEREESEEAFNLLEQLSELERVHRLVPLVLGPISVEERRRLRRVYPRLLKIEDLRGRLSAAKDADKGYVLKLLKQEEEILERYIGKKRERLPSLVQLASKEAVQDRFMILLGLALHAEEAADAALKEGKGPEADSLRRTYLELIDRYGRILDQAGALAREGEAPGILGILRPDPVELIDVMEGLPEGETCLRLFPVPGPGRRWAAFTITAEDIEVEQFRGQDPFDLTGDGTKTIVYEDLSSLPIRIRGPVALSATHLVRSIQGRKPFKRTILELPARYHIPEPFEDVSLPVGAAEAEILGALPGTHILLLNTATYRASTVPTRSGHRPVPFMALGLDQGRAFPLLRLSDRLSNVSLALLPGASLADAYPLGHLLSLFGVPTVLLPRSAGSGSPFIEPFLRAYGSSSAEQALRTARSDIGAGQGWIQLGYRGMGQQEARTFASKRFNRYVQGGVNAYKTNRPMEALVLFENALNVTEEIKSLQRHQPGLHKSARESAFSAGRIEKALYHAQALADILDERQPGSEAHAEALLKLGLIQARAEQYEKAVPALEEAVEMMADLELGPEQVAALSDLGIVLENATEYDRALVRFQSAASLSKALNKKKLLARQYRSIGRLYDLRLSQYARARQLYGDAYAIYRELGQKGNMAQSLLDMGRCYRLLGNFNEASEHYQKALDLVEDDGKELLVKASIMIEQSHNAWFQARYQEAFSLQRRVYKLARKEGWPLEQVIALNTSGLTWWTLGDHKRALRELGRALDLARTLRARQDVVATTLNNMGLVYREMGRFQEALEALGKALSIDREINSRWAIAYDLRNMALTYLRMGEAERALPLFKEALGTARGIGNRINEAKILLGFGEALAALDRQAKAYQAFDEALRLSRSMVMRETEWRALYGLGLLRLKEGRKEEARDLLTRATAVIEGMRADIKLDQLKDGFINNKMDVYETLVSLLVDLGKTAEAFDIAERSRARNMIDLLGNQRLNLHGAVDQELYDRQKRLRARIREHEALLAQAADEAERSVYGQSLNGFQDDYRDLMLEIQAKNPELASLISVNPLTLDDIRALLEPDVALLAFYLVSDEIFCWLVRHESVELFRTPIGRESLRKSILNYRRMIQNLEPLEIQSKELYSLLFSRVMARLASGSDRPPARREQVRVLGIIPHGTLHHLSFGTLFDGENYLADRFPLFYLPSASVLKFTLERRREEKNRRVLAIGNPDLGNPALNLPFAEHEVGAIGWNFPDITVLTREKATESWVVRHIGEFGIIHMASHGEFDYINPLFSSVKLVKDIRSDGDLEASEIFGLQINADLVMLSACQTGLGKVTGGDDVIGMNRAFLYAGTHAIVSSLWRVSDISTAILVKQFYREYVSNNKSGSLRRAILHVKNRYPHPGYWGAFVLVGDYY